MTDYPFAAEVITEADLKSRVSELGEAISKDYQGRAPLFVVVLTGSVLFAADLVRNVDVPSEVDFLGLNRFGESGRIGISMDSLGGRWS